MTLAISPPIARQAARPKARVTSRGRSAGVRPKTGPSARAKRSASKNESGLLGGYVDPKGAVRRVVALPGACGSVLVVDRDAVTLGDCRLVAHLATDEPAENAAVACEQYLQNPAGRWCRCVTPEDLALVPFADVEELEPRSQAPLSAKQLTDRHGRTYCLEICSTGMSIPVLRWWRKSSSGEPASFESISMREVIASLESYEPVRTLTHRALALHRDNDEVSIAVLRAECARMDASKIVLNRGLRRAVLAAAATQGLTMSEIAMRCGRVKRDCRGKESGETSWLARRLGIAPEGGKSTPTPWIHSDVLALIARCGLGISPREVELG
jgi:hypothetical protein